MQKITIISKVIRQTFVCQYSKYWRLALCNQRNSSTVPYITLQKAKDNTNVKIIRLNTKTILCEQINMKKKLIFFITSTEIYILFIITKDFLS